MSQIRTASILFAILYLAAAAGIARADSGPRADVTAIRKLLTHPGGKCPQSVSNVAIYSGYALATVLQRGACDAGFVVVLGGGATRWRSIGAIGGVPDACSVHAKGVPLTKSATLVRRFTGSNDPSLTSTAHCKP